MTDSLFKTSFSGSRVKQVRELLGENQTEIGASVGVTQGAIAQVEGQFKNASADLVQRIAARSKRFEVPFFYDDPTIELAVDSVMFRAKASMTRTEESQARRYTEVVCELAA